MTLFEWLLRRQSTARQPTALESWAAKYPRLRGAEIAYISDCDLGSAPSIEPTGELYQPFAVGDWVFLLCLDRDFPRAAADGGPSARAYLVLPSYEELCEQVGRDLDGVAFDASGAAYVVMGDLGDAGSETIDQPHSRLAMDAARRLRDRYAGFSDGPRHLGRRRSSGGVPKWRRPYPLQEAGYVDGRSTKAGTRPNRRCRKVVLSDRALAQIYRESSDRIETETGGLLLGHYERGVWYVVEATDPGWASIFGYAHHEGDEVYENHVGRVISRLYRHPLVLLGMWHRHPGSFDRFSATDDVTNAAYADACGNGSLSALVNFDPDFRLTFYYVEHGEDGSLGYTRVDVEAGDELFENPEILELAEVNVRDALAGRRPAGEAVEKSTAVDTTIVAIEPYESSRR